MNSLLPNEEDLFDAARRISDAGELAAFLESACSGDHDLRQRIERLLGVREQAELLFRPLANQIDPVSADAVIATPAGDASGGKIGRYTLREKLGEGGFGVVYLAEQAEPVRRQVALKIIKLGMDTRQFVARFEAERQALALMDHPNIAKVFDGGAIGSDGVSIGQVSPELAPGRPYFVMELVRGVPITQHCKERSLSLESRLALFLDDCEAVQHAHQKGVIHRDLKPSNILVTVLDGRPIPKVIDFGVAKATGIELTDKTLVTRLDHFIGTPAYMSPEQAGAGLGDVDTRSDIYSLGVLLYELLTGTPPFDGRDLVASGPDEMRRTIRECEAVRPSTRIRRTTDRRRFPRRGTLGFPIAADLDWIAMKCLEKDRARRYQTANGLASDVRRFLANEPVTARPPGGFYRFSKAVRRHRAASAALALVALATVIAVVVSTWALVKEWTARRESEERLGAALEFVEKVIQNVAPKFVNLTGATDAQQEIGQASFDLVDRLRTHSSDSPRLRLTRVRTLLFLSSAQNPGAGNTAGNHETGLGQAREALEILDSGSLPISAEEEWNLRWRGEFAIVQCLYGLGR